jgi:hypothetical protein
MIVKILVDEPRFGLKKGQFYNATPYWIDPGSKVTLLNRVSKKGKHFKRNPWCNEYRNRIKVISNKDIPWQK